MSQCAPDIDSNSDTCFTYKQLQSIAKKFNSTAAAKTKISISKKKDVLWNQIHKQMKYKCNNDESCWTDDNKLLQQFRPKKPKEWNSNPREWLSNFDIQKVMIQYEKKYKTFKFLGVFPDDYDHKIFMNTCVAEELCNLDINDLLKNNKYQLGTIFNTDPHYLGGSHWVAVYVNTDKKSNKYGFYYYDSNAQQPSKYIVKLYNEIKSQLEHNTKSKNFAIHINDNKHQFKNTECGMFSMDFIINMLKRTNTFKMVTGRNISDDDVFKLRNKYYN